MLFSMAGRVSWLLPFRPAVSNVEFGFSFFSHFRYCSFRWKNSFIIIFISSCESNHGGVFCSCVDSVRAQSALNLCELFCRFLGLVAPG